MLALLQDARSQASVLFEVGIAVGLGKPVIVLVDSNDPMPVDLAGTLVLRSGVRVATSLRFAIDQLGLQPGPAIPAPPPPTHPPGTILGAHAATLLARVANGESPSEAELISIVSDALSRTGSRR